MTKAQDANILLQSIVTTAYMNHIDSGCSELLAKKKVVVMLEEIINKYINSCTEEEKNIFNKGSYDSAIQRLKKAINENRDNPTVVDSCLVAINILEDK
jgi:hypothetical protein